MNKLRSWLSGIPKTPRALIHSTNFFRWHVIVGILLPLAGGGIFVACNTNLTVAYIDALFMCTSALSLTGLTVVDMSAMSFGQQFILYLLLQLGSIQSISILTLLVRRATFNKRFSDQHRYFPTRNNKSIKEDVEAAEVVLDSVQRDERAREERDIEENAAPDTDHAQEQEPQDEQNRRSSSRNSDARSDTSSNHSSPADSNKTDQPRKVGRGGFPNPLLSLYSEGWTQLRKRYRSNNQELGEPLLERGGQARAGGEVHEEKRKEAREKWGRNSSIKQISSEGFIRLAKLEISAMTLLLYATTTFWISVQLFAIILWAPYFSAGHYESTFQSGSSPGTSKTWFAIFQAASMMNNCGLTLVDTSLIGFRTAYIMLIPAVFMIVGGNLGYPVFVRAGLYIFNRFLPKHSNLRQLTNFILAHPRRIFIYLFPPYETVALVVAICILTSVDWIAFFVLDINYESNTVFTIPAGSAVLSGLVQSVSVRSAGFYVVGLYETAPALHILYIFMMIFAIYPLALAIRATNVYEEKALGITESNEFDTAHGLEHLKQEEGYVGLHFKEQLAYDVWYIIFTVWLICIIERNQLESAANQTFGNFSIFMVIFEVCSAYANVGLSIGNSSSNTSTSANFRHLSKLILCVTMIRGRTRGLPIQIDRSIMTPRELDKHGDPPEKPMQERKPAQEAQQES